MGQLVTAKLKAADRRALEAAITRFRAAFDVAKASPVQQDDSGFWVFLDYVEEGTQA